MSELSESETCQEKWTEIKETVDICRQREEHQRQRIAKMEAFKIRQKTFELQVRIPIMNTFQKFLLIINYE